MITRYVNTASTPGGDGTTNATTGANRAYASAYDALIGRRFSTLTDVLRIYCSGTAADTTALDHAPLEIYTTPTCYIELIGNNTTGKWNASAYRLEVLNVSALYNQYAAHLRVYNFQIMVKTTDNVDRNGLRLSTANNYMGNGAGYQIAKNCIVRRDPTSSGTGRVYLYTDSIQGDGSGGVCYRINCLAYGSYAGFISDSGVWCRDNLYNYNCTGYGNQFNWADAQICVNCLSAAPGFGDGYGFLGTGTLGHSNNAADESSAGGTNARDNQTFSFVDAANGDFHLLSTDTGAKGFGLTDPGAGLYSDDIDGQTRSGAWDIGADQFVMPVEERDGTSAGAGLATGQSGEIEGKTGTSVGAGTASVDSGSTQGRDGNISGATTVSGQKGEVAGRQGGISGQGTTDIKGADIESRAGSGIGQSTPAGVSGSIQGVGGTSAGSALASGESSDASLTGGEGTSEGSATVLGQSAHIEQSDGGIAGQGAAQADAATIKTREGVSDGLAQILGQSGRTHSVTGTSAGSSSAVGDTIAAPLTPFKVVPARSRRFNSLPRGNSRYTKISI